MRGVSQEALIALELFRLSPQSKKGLKEIQQHLVEVSMHVRPEARSLSEIVSACSEILGQPYSLSDSECMEALRNSCKLGRIQQKTSDAYDLSGQIREELTRRQKEFLEAEIAFNKGLVESVGKTLKTVVSPLVEPLLCATVRDVIQEVFHASAVRLMSLLSAKRDIISALSQDSNMDSQLAGKLKTFVTLQKGATVEQVIEGIKAFLANLDTLQRRYVGNLHRRALYFQILNLDPNLQAIQKKSFENTKLYLDTNVVINYVCDGTRLHQTVFDILRASVSLGAKLFVSPITLVESEELVNEALKFNIYLKDGQIMKVMQASSAAMSNPIIEGFRNQRAIYPKLNWEAYVSPMRNLEEYLLGYDVLVEKEFTDDIDKDELYQKVYKEMSIIKSDKFESICVHDTSNFILVQRLRNKYPGTPLGSAVWLLTLDSKLPVLDKRMHRSYRIPHCRMLEQWGEVLVNFQNVGKFIASDDYVTYLASQKLGAYIEEKTIDIHVIESIANSEIAYEKILSLEPEIASNVIQDLQKDREAGQLIEQLQLAPQEEKEELADEVAMKVASSQSEYIEKVKRQAEDEITRLETGIRELKGQLQELSSAREKDNEAILTIGSKLKSTEEQLSAFRKMSFWDRLKYLFRP